MSYEQQKHKKLYCCLFHFRSITFPPSPTHWLTLWTWKFHLWFWSISISLSPSPTLSLFIYLYLSLWAMPVSPTVEWHSHTAVPTVAPELWGQIDSPLSESCDQNVRHICSSVTECILTWSVACVRDITHTRIGTGDRYIGQRTWRLLDLSKIHNS